MTAPRRCRDCRHKPGPRVVTQTRKTEGNPASLAEPRFHKKPCDCACHGAHEVVPVAPAGLRWGGAV